MYNYYYSYFNFCRFPYYHPKTRCPIIYIKKIYSFIHTIFLFFYFLWFVIYLYSLIFPSLHLKTHRRLFYTLTFIFSFIDFSYLFIVISVGLSPIYAVLHLPICKHIIWLFYSLNSFLIIYHFSTGLGLHSPVCIAHFLLFWTLFL